MTRDDSRRLHVRCDIATVRRHWWSRRRTVYPIFCDDCGFVRMAPDSHIGGLLMTEHLERTHGAEVGRTWWTDLDPKRLVEIPSEAFR